MSDIIKRAGMSSERLRRIGPIIEQHFGEEKIAGVVALLERKGDRVHFDSYGLMDRENNKPMVKDAIFRIFSMTKPITAVALLTLLEKGLVRLSDPASRFLPAFEKLKVYDGTGLDGLKLADLDTDVTIRQLLTHTSGLTYHFYEYGPVEQMYRDAGVCSNKKLDAFVDDLLEFPLTFQPGTMWRYSFGLDVIARIVEIASGKTFGDYLQESIFDPLGMTDTGFYVPADKLDRYCAEYGFGNGLDPEMSYTKWWGDEGRMKPRLIRAADEGLEAKPHDIYRGGHGLVSTAEDYLKFCQMLLHSGESNGARILGRKTVELMTVNHLSGSQTPEDLIGPGWGFGLGVRVLTDVGQCQTLGTVGEHGWAGAAGTYYWIDPAEDFIGIYMTQFQPGSFFQSAVDFKTAAYQAIVD
jgi:CubicO group peptidase (beta-lactamase class C family)